MKTCAICKQPKPESEFNKHAKRKDGLQTKCRSCGKQKAKDYYQSNRADLMRVIGERKKETIKENYRRIFEYLQAHPCVDCGEADPVVLDFDHVRGEKDRHVSRMASMGMSWTTLVAEIQKCEVRCANCHRRKTARERGYFRAVHSGIIQLAGYEVLTLGMLVQTQLPEPTKPFRGDG